MEIELKNYRRMLLEAGEDEEPKDEQPEDDKDDDTSKEGKEDDAKEASEGNDEDDKDAQDVVDQVDEPFSGLDLRKARCFGYSVPQQNNWLYNAHQADDVGWPNIDKEALEKNLTKDVEKSYMSIAQYKLTNIDDETAYDLWFDNNKELWSLEILNSPKAEISVEERANFFKSSIFKKIAKKTYYRLMDALDFYNKIVKQHLDNGELLLVDSVKLDAILHFIESAHFMDNVLNGKYVNY